MTVISLGAGVQSSTLALMASAGEVRGYKMPDFAVFSDTGWEPKAVYSWLDWLEKQLPFPVYRVNNGNLRDDLFAAVDNGDRVASIPFHLKTLGGGMAWRQCTSEYKILPITKFIRDRRPKDEDVELWIGISLDEVQRMKNNKTRWIQNVWPLIDMRMTRFDCINWMKAHGFPEPPKSSCVGCPYHDNAYWKKLRKDSPEEFADAVAVDVKIRHMPKFNAELYIHPSKVPLSEVDLDADKDQLDLFSGECEGMCGV